MQENKVIPIFRIFDQKKAIEFYIDWLGFKVEWEHRFEDNMPLYFEISRGDITLHLTEHYGDCSPGARIFIWCKELRDYYSELILKPYPFNKPCLEETFYESLSMELTDPFGNRLTFNEKLHQ